VDSQGAGKDKEATTSPQPKLWVSDFFKDYPADDDSLELEDEEEDADSKGKMTEEEKKKLIQELIQEKIEENKKTIPGMSFIFFLKVQD
jgi:hypothetical protein